MYKRRKCEQLITRGSQIAVNRATFIAEMVALFIASFVDYFIQEHDWHDRAFHVGCRDEWIMLSTNGNIAGQIRRQDRKH